MTQTDLSKRTPEEVFNHHVQALGAEDLDAIIVDYADTAILISPAGVLRGKEAIRGFFADLIRLFPRRNGQSKPSTWTMSSFLSGPLIPRQRVSPME